MNPEPRIGDAEREAAAAALGEHFAAGRLTKEEYDERADVVWAARTASDLRPLFLDLPSTRVPPGRPTNQPLRQSRPAWAGLPLMPLMAVLLLVVILVTGAPWLLFVFGWMFFCGPWRGASHRSRRT